MSNIALLIPNITDKAGTERAVSNLANILCEQKHIVYIFSIASDAGKEAYLLNPNIQIIHLNLPYLKHNFVFAIKHYYQIFTRIKAKLKELNIDIVIGTYTLINILIIRLSKNSKKIGCEHFNYEACGKIQNLLKKIFYKYLDAVVLLTKRDRLKYSFLKNAYVIPNSLPFSPSTFSSCGNKKMISLGRLTKQKGYDLLIDSISMIKDEITDWSVEIFGVGKDKEVLEHKIYENGLDGILTIKPPVSDVEAVYTSASIYLSSSRYEGLPMTLLEAQSCGIPCIVFDCPCGPAEIVVNNETGFVVPLFDTKSFAEKTIELAKDENLRKKFGKRAQELSKRFSSESVAEKWENLIAELSGEEC